ncbi:MAG: ATP-grasp domain-containing protein [bacterium]|nr:ATP-grasp domain-containing protein [bacterium]
MKKTDKYLYIVGGGILQVPTVEVAKNMGLKTLVTDGSPEAPAMKIADKTAVISTKDIPKHLAFAKIFAKTHKIAGVYTQGTDVEVTVASIAAELGLPGIKVAVARACNNKILMRQKLATGHVPGPKFQYALTYEEAREKARIIGYPLVVKSIDNSASRGIRIIRHERELVEACTEALKYSLDKKILLEEYLEGVEYSVDTVMYKGVLYPAGISDREFDYSRSFAIQTGSLTPSLLPEETQASIYELMAKAAKAMGVDNGAFKGDIIISAGMPKILEITARLSGGFDSQYRKPYSFGINLIKATMDIALGNELDFRDLIPRWVKYSKTFSPFPNPGMVKSISGLKKLKKLPGIKQVFMMIGKGDTIEDYRHCANRVAHLIVTGDTYAQLKEREKKALATLKIRTV